MRTFIIASIAFISLMAASSMGCAPEDDNCGQTSGCVPPPPETCGDNACQADEGETADNCPEDCVPDTCGDGTCSAEYQETSDNCPQDCNVTCLDPELPVYCENTNSCWQAGTNCDVQSYTCGGKVHLCGSTEYAFSCCDGRAYGCPSFAPYKCLASDSCVETQEQCPGGAEACTVWAAECGPL